MTWYVKVRSADKTVASILKDVWNQAVADVAEFRKTGREAWIEDTNGRVIDETRGKVKS